MKTIWKFLLPVEDVVWTRMPAGAKLLSVQRQRDEICVWALVDPAQPLVRRYFRWYGTGHPVRTVDAATCFVGTVQYNDLVFHLFDQGEA